MIKQALGFIGKGVLLWVGVILLSYIFNVFENYPWMWLMVLFVIAPLTVWIVRAWDKRKKAPPS